MRLERLRRQRVLRPRILLSYAVSSKTGHGLKQLRRALSVLMQNEVLFPHVGMEVPLNYAMLERLAQEGRGRVDAEADEKAEADEMGAEIRVGDLILGKYLTLGWYECKVVAKKETSWVVEWKHGDENDTLKSPNDLMRKRGRAAWESAVTKHVKVKASDALRRLCGRPHVTLPELETEAGKVGMDGAELHSALAFLHATGSVLYYGTDPRHQDSRELVETVFMQPQFIINAIKYVIRERKPEDVNDELREMDKRIRNRRDLNDLFTKGELTGSLLIELWTFDKSSYTTQDRKLLLEVMKGFKLLRLLGPPGEAMRERYVVPAMLPNHELPDKYVTPEWWCPEKADEAAGFDDAQAKAPGLAASMRVMYEVVWGRLPFSFMSKLQVSLTLKPSKDAKHLDAKHYAPEAAIVDRVAGSVMSDTYTCGGGNVTEWVVVSQCTKSCHVGAVDGTPEDLTELDSIRVVAWAELINESQHGTTDWRLFKRVMHEVECEERESPGLYLRKLALYVGADGQCAKPEIVEEFRDSEFFTFTFRFEQESERIEKVKRNRVLPLENVETPLVKRQAVSRGTVKAGRVVGTKFCVDAFFAKTMDDKMEDKGIDVHAESQVMTRIISMDSACGWECTQNSKPTLEDLRTSIKTAQERNVKGLHLSGHGSKTCGFVWNTKDSATAGIDYPIHILVEIVGSATGQRGPIEFVMLNACSTENLCRELLKVGIMYGVCWKTLVHDEIAREMCESFWRALTAQSKKDSNKDGSPPRDYRHAFDTAVEEMKKFTVVYAVGTPKHQLSTPVSSRGADVSGIELDDMECPASDEHLFTDEGNTMSSLREHGRYGQATRGKVASWQLEDVVQFLSKDGKDDSEPVYLWWSQNETEKV
jgi:hypothetical protein